MKIRHSRIFAIAFLVIGPLLILFAVLNETPINYFTGGVLTLVGILMLFQPIAVISNFEVKAKSPAGLTLGTYPVRFPGDLAIAKNKLWHVPTHRKIAPLGIAAHKPDVERLQHIIAGSHGQAPAASSPHEYREQPQPDTYLGGNPWGGAPQHPGSMDTPTPHTRFMPDHQDPSQDQPQQ